MVLCTGGPAKSAHLQKLLLLLLLLLVLLPSYKINCVALSCSFFTFFNVVRAVSFFLPFTPMWHKAVMINSFWRWGESKFGTITESLFNSWRSCPAVSDAKHRQTFRLSRIYAPEIRQVALKRAFPKSRFFRRRKKISRDGAIVVMSSRDSKIRRLSRGRAYPANFLTLKRARVYLRTILAAFRRRFEQF